MEVACNSSNPYNFTYVIRERDEADADEFLTRPYWPYERVTQQVPRLIYRHLKNVKFQFAYTREISRRLSNANVNVKFEAGFNIGDTAIKHGIIDGAALIFGIGPKDPYFYHISPICFSNYWVIVSSVREDARRESSETLSFQGLSTLVWVLVAFSLLVVTGLVSYSGFKTEKKNRRESPLKSWINNIWIYAADILNNCVAGVVRPGTGRHLRTWWLLGVVFLIQFWMAGMKSDLLLDHSSFIDSLEDLFAKPKLIAVIKRHGRSLISKGHPRFQDYLNMKKRIVTNLYDKNSTAILGSGSGVVLQQFRAAIDPNYDLFKKLKEAKRKKYIGKTQYHPQYAYMLYKRRLPRAIKEDLDYLTSKLSETRQTEPRLRRDKFETRKYHFDAKENSAATMSWSAYNVQFLSPVFRMWIIGMSLAIFVFFVERFRSRVLRRKPVKISPHHSIGIKA